MFSSVVSRCSDSTQKIRVLIAERDCKAGQLLTESLERDSRYQVVALPPVAELLSVAALRKPDVAVISADFVAGPRKGLQIARTLTARFPNIRIVVLLEVIERAVNCQTNKQIANQLRLSEHTLTNYLFLTFEKLDVSSQMELLFLLSSQNKGSFSTPAGLTKEGLSNAAQQGWLSPQFIVAWPIEALAADKHERSGYYRRRIAEEKSTAIRKQIYSSFKMVKARMIPRVVEELEKSVMAQKGHVLVTKKMSGFVRRRSE